MFGWRLDLKHRLITGRVALLRGDPGRARPRPASWSRARAHSVSPGTSAWPACSGTGRTGPWDGRWTSIAVADLDLLDASVAIEAWWWTGEVAADFANPAWLDRAVDRADRLARHAGVTRTGCGGTWTSACAAGGPRPGGPRRLS